MNLAQFPVIKLIKLFLVFLYQVTAFLPSISLYSLLLSKHKMLTQAYNTVLFTAWSWIPPNTKEGYVFTTQLPGSTSILNAALTYA